MEKINTGFSINPFVGHLTEDQELCKYIKTQYIISLLNENELWFNRILKWQQMDPREGELLPVFKKKIHSQHKDPHHREFHQTIIKQSLVTNFGCCFSIWEGEENDHMWQVFTPEQTNYGVIIVTTAGDIYKSMPPKLNNSIYLSKVKYLKENKIKSMKPDECTHSNKKSFHYEESHFLKHAAYGNEKEVRAIISSNEYNWTSMLHKYIREEKIPTFLPGTKTPHNCVRIDMKDSMTIQTLSDEVVFLNTAQLVGFINFMKKFNAENVPAGIRLPFSPFNIKKIIFHSKLDNTSKEAIQNLVSKKGLQCEIITSHLYDESW